MAPSLKMASLVAAVLLLLVATPQARGWAPEGEQVSDMAPVPVRTPADMAIPGDAGAMVAWSRSACVDDCWCCSGSNRDGCQNTRCCTNISCDDPTGNCVITQDCGCRC